MTYNGQTTNYLQDSAAGLPVVLQEKVVSQTTASSFMYVPGSTQPLYQTDPTNANAWYHTDAVGSVRAMTNDSGAILNNYTFGAFGQTTDQSETITNSHQFAGEQLDPTGFYYNRARYYDSSIGRFLGQDSYAGNASDPQSQNLYPYAQNNPVLYNDPSGHCL